MYDRFFPDIVPSGYGSAGFLVAPTLDGNLYLMGAYVKSAGPNSNGHYVYKLDKNGNTLWSRYYDDEVVHLPSGTGFFYLMPNNRLFIADNDGFIMWVDSESGDVLNRGQIQYWEHLLAPSKLEAAVYVTCLVGFEGHYLAKLTPDGLAWQVLPFIPQAGAYFEALDLTIGPDDNAYILGQEGYGTGTITHILNRITPNGTVVPIKRWTVPGNTWNYSNYELGDSYVKVYPDGNFLIYDYDRDRRMIYIQERSPAGDVLNQREIPLSNDPEVLNPAGHARRMDVGSRVFLSDSARPFDASKWTWSIERDLSCALLPETEIARRPINQVDEAGYLFSLGWSGDQFRVYSPAGSPLNDWYTVPEGQTLVVGGGGVRNNDLGAATLTAERMSLPANGTLAFQITGAFNFSSTGGWGNTSFLYRLRNGAYASRKATVTISIKPILPSLLTTNKLELYGGQTATMTVRLERPAAVNGAVVTLASTFFQVPATVTVPGGAQQVSFSAVAKPQSADRVAAVNAIRAGKMISKSMTIKASELASLAVNKGTLKGGGSFLLYVGLIGTAPSPGLKVNLSSDKAVVPVPPSLTVPTNLSVKSISVVTHTTSTTQVATITGQHGSVTKTVTVTVTP